MMPVGVIAVLLALVPAQIAAEQDAAVNAAIAAPMRALDAALAREAALPPATTDAERLERLGTIDQSFRLQMHKMPLKGLSAEQVKAAYAAIAARTEPIDQRNRDAVMAMLPKEGWFSFTAYGRPASEAAFHIINHSDLDTQQKVLPAFERLAMQGEADRADYATMYDRVQKGLGRPQRYGTQSECVDGRWAPYKLEDPERVEERRRPMGFRVTFAEMEQRLAKSLRRC